MKTAKPSHIVLWGFLALMAATAALVLSATLCGCKSLPSVPPWVMSGVSNAVTTTTAATTTSTTTTAAPAEQVPAETVTINGVVYEVAPGEQVRCDVQPPLHPPQFNSEGATMVNDRDLRRNGGWRWNPDTSGRGVKLLCPKETVGRLCAVSAWDGNGWQRSGDIFGKTDMGYRPRVYWPRPVPKQMAIRVDTLDGDYVLWLEDTSRGWK